MTSGTAGASAKTNDSALPFAKNCGNTGCRAAKIIGGRHVAGSAIGARSGRDPSR